MVAKIKSKVKKSNKAIKKAVKKAMKNKKVIKSVKKSNKAIKVKTKVNAKGKGKVKVKAKVAVSKTKSRPQSKPKVKAISKTVAKKKKVVTIRIKPTKKISEAKKSTIKAAVVAKKKPLKSSEHIQDIFSGYNQEVDHQMEYHHPVMEKTSCHAVSKEVDPLLSGPSKFEPYHIHTTEEYMNEQQLQHFTNILDAWKQDLMVEVDHTISEMKEADILADPNDRATQEETFNLELRARDRERKLIKKIETALKKIKDHEYGYCDSCGVEIGVRRLEARPTATLCIECKTLAEMREKRV